MADGKVKEAVMALDQAQLDMFSPKHKFKRRKIHNSILFTLMALESDRVQLSIEETTLSSPNSPRRQIVCQEELSQSMGKRMEWLALLVEGN